MNQRLEPYVYRRNADVPAFDDSHPIIIFDGACVLCSRFVRFVLAHDRCARLRFLAAQTPLGEALYRCFGLRSGDFETYVLLEGGRIRVKSDAALRIFRLLGWPWAILAAGEIIPRFVRDAAYDFIVRNRIRWFGARETCYAPTPEEAARFIT